MAEATEELHILENKWVISEQYQFDTREEKTQGYENSFEKLCSFGTIEAFWGFWKKIPAISDVFYDGNEKLVIRTDSRTPEETSKKYKILGQCLFKEGIEPKYEDAQNEKEEDHDKLSYFWESLVLGMIGETLDDGDHLTGARVIDKSNSYKKQVNHRVEIWFRDWKDDAFKEQLQERVRKIMEECNVHPQDLTFSENDYSRWK